MRRGALGRAVLGLVVTMGLAAAVRPRSWPRADLLDPTARAAEVTEFGLRLLAAILAAYLALVFLGLTLTALRLVPSSVRTVVDRWTTRGVAGALRRAVGLSALALGVLPLQSLAVHAAEAAPVLAPDETAPPRATAPRLEPAGPPPPATAPRLEPVLPPATTPPPVAPLPAAPEPAPEPRPPPAPLPATARKVTARVGDSFWTIAERLTSARLGRPATDSEVLEPWLALIDANRDRLTDPADADLLFPGQILRLPD